MINFTFNISNPWSTRWSMIKAWHGSTPIKHKYWEIQLNKTNSLVSFDLQFNIRQDHAGFFINAALIGYEVMFNIYDHRHWDHKNNRWETEGDTNA